MKNGKAINLEEMGDDEMLHVFLRKALPEFCSLIEAFLSQLRAGEKFNAIELFAVLQGWREIIAYIWAAHSPRQQPAYENLIREDWNHIRAMQKQIYKKVEREYERRKVVF
jgi:hypothetical protein